LVGSPSPPYDFIDTYPEVDLADPLNPTAVIVDLESDVTYSFVVTSYGTEGIESDFSNAVSVLNGKIIDCGGDISGGGGGGCFINTAANWFRTSENILGALKAEPPYSKKIRIQSPINLSTIHLLSVAVSAVCCIFFQFLSHAPFTFALFPLSFFC